jgi:hypothetical protein
MWNHVVSLEKSVQKASSYLIQFRENLDFYTNEMDSIVRDLNWVKSEFNNTESPQQIFNKVQMLSANLNEIQNFIVSFRFYSIFSATLFNHFFKMVEQKTANPLVFFKVPLYL